MAKPDIDDVFGGISKAKGRVNSTYVGPGRYIAIVRKVKLDKSRKKKTFLALESTILKVLKGGGDEPIHKVGDSVSHLIMEEWDGFLSDVQAMFSVLTGHPGKKITVDVCKRICGDDQPIEGYVFEMHNRNKVTNNDKDFTVVSYKRRLSPEEVQEEISSKALESEKVGGKKSKKDKKGKKGKKSKEPEPEPEAPKEEKPKKKKKDKKGKKKKDKGGSAFNL